MITPTRVEWFHGYINSPVLHLVTDEFPTLTEYRFKQKGNLYWAEKRGFVHFFYYVSPGDGYGGLDFLIIMEDGTSKILTGPWSSRSGVMNDHFPHSVPVVVNDLYATHILMPLAQEACKALGLHLVTCKSQSGEVSYAPSYVPDQVIKFDRYVVIVSDDGKKYSLNRNYIPNKGDKCEDVDLTKAVDTWEHYTTQNLRGKAYWLY